MNVPGRRLALISLGAFVLAACSENVSLFSSLDDELGPQLATVEAGTVLPAAAEFPVQIEYASDDASRATDLLVELRAPDGMVHGTARFGSEELAEPELPAISLPQPPAGVYELSITAWIGDQVLFEEERQVFILDEPPEILSLAIYPSSISPASLALAIAEIEASDDARPYARWLFDGESFAAGYVENGLDRAVIDGTDMTAGAYRVTLEIYPWGPDEGAVIDGATSIETGADVLVRSTPPAGDDPLWPGPGTLVDSYSLDGTLASSGDNTAVRTGETTLDLVAGALGFSIAAEGMVAVPVPDISADDAAVLFELTTAGALASVDGDMEPLVLERAADAREGVTAEEALRTTTVVLSTQDERLRMEVFDDSGLPVSSAPVDTALLTDGPVLTVRGGAERSLFLDHVHVVRLTADELAAFHYDRVRQQLARVLDESWQLVEPEPDTTVDPEGEPREIVTVPVEPTAERRIFLLLTEPQQVTDGPVIETREDDLAVWTGRIGQIDDDTVLSESGGDAEGDADPVPLDTTGHIAVVELVVPPVDPLEDGETGAPAVSEGPMDGAVLLSLPAAEALAITGDGVGYRILIGEPPR